MTEPKYIKEEVRDYLSYDEHTGNLAWIKKTGSKTVIGNTAGWYNKEHGHFYVTVNGTTYTAHRVAWYLKTGVQPPMFIDHHDGDGANNKWDNLRLADKSTNGFNRGKQSNNKSGYKGVSWSKHNSKWRAYINKQGKQHHLGYFDDPEEAHIVYCNKAHELHGNFAHH